MAAKPISIALLGADAPRAEAILRELEDRDLEVGEILPLALAESDASLSFRGEDLPLIDADGFDWASVDLVLVASQAPAVLRQIDAIAKAGKAVLGPDLPAGAAVALARVLAAVARETGLTSAHASLNLPVSEHGLAAVEELSAQTRALFAMESPEPGVLPPRIAFNIVPDPAGPNGVSPVEERIESGLLALLGKPDMPVMVQVCWVPVFFGSSAVLHLTAEHPQDLSRLRKCLGGMHGVTVMDEAIPAGLPTPATDAQESTDVFVGRLRVSGADTRQASLWLVFDGLRLEAAQIADRLENLIEKNQNSVLT